MTSMKPIHRILALAALATAFLSQALPAQSADSVRVRVPFAFEYGDHHFAAGTYAVSLVGTGHVLSVSNYTGSGMSMVGVGDESRGPSVSYLIFHKYGNRYFLAEYHQNGSHVTAKVLNTKAEHSVAREFAANQASERNAVQVALLENGAIFSLQR